MAGKFLIIFREKIIIHYRLFSNILTIIPLFIGYQLSKNTLMLRRFGLGGEIVPGMTSMPGQGQIGRR